MIDAESISDIIYFRYIGKWCEERKVRELETQIEAMKCCGNCNQYDFPKEDKTCNSCNRGVEWSKEDNWQLAEKRGE